MQKLSESELSIMMKIWEADKPLYLEEIADLLEEFNWAISTVRNFLTRIIDKGYLKVEKDGRKNIYITLVSKEYINRRGKGLIKNLYNNSVKKFVAELYESDSIDQEDLLDLKDYLDEKINQTEDGVSPDKEKFNDPDKTEEFDREEELDKQRQAKEDKKQEKVVLRRLKNIL